MKKAIIVAASLNNVIGKNGKIPWHLPDDLKHFKKLTHGSAIIMGRKTYESIGKALPGRCNIVISSTLNNIKEAPLCWVFPDIESAVRWRQFGILFFVGGQGIYEAVLPIVDTMYITRVLDYFDGDTFFPAIDLDIWTETERIFHDRDAKHLYPFQLFTYERKIPHPHL